MKSQRCRATRPFASNRSWLVAVAGIILLAPPANADNQKANADDVALIRQSYAEKASGATRFDFNAIRTWYDRNLADTYISKAIAGGTLGTRPQVLAAFSALSGEPKESNAMLAAQFPKSTITILHIDARAANEFVVTIRNDAEIRSQGVPDPNRRPAKTKVLDTSQWDRETWKHTPKGLQLVLSQVVAIKEVLDGHVVQNYGTIPR